MSTIRIESEKILRILNGGNVPRDSKFSEQDVQYMVRDTAAKLVKGEWFNERNEGGKVIDSRYVVTFRAIDVAVDSATNENYIFVPVKSYIRLPNGAGLQSVRPDASGTNTRRSKKAEYRAFIPIPHRFEDIYWQLPAASLENVFGWMVRKDRIYFTKRGGKTLIQDDISKVVVDVVTVDPVAVGIDEHLPLSAEMSQQLVLEVIQIFKGGAPAVVDTIDNQNPNITKVE